MLPLEHVLVYYAIIYPNLVLYVSFIILHGKFCVMQVRGVTEQIKKLYSLD